jgi:hypothetical protein
MKNGQPFDRQLAHKIFETLDLDRSGSISVEEFIKSYLSIEDEIKSTVKEFQAKYMKEKDNNIKLKKLVMENQNEKINEEGIGQNAKITIEITEVEFLKHISGIKGISIRIVYREDVKDTKFVAGMSEKINVKEKFEL